MDDHRNAETAQIIAPPISLADKVGTISGDLDEEEIVRRAEAEIEALKAQYPEWVLGHIADLEAACVAARDDPEHRGRHLDTLAAVAHDVKGEGTSYDYPLMTALGDSLCRLARDLKDGAGGWEDRKLTLAAKHIEAMRIVIRERMSGDGGEGGAELIASLREAVEKLTR
ncbi:MAG: hypothetical protein ACE5H8_04960 [Alphaproteobacteria bacterium]